MTTTENDRAQQPDADHSVLELTYEVRSTHRLRLGIGKWAEDFADWFDVDFDSITPDKVHDLLVNSRHFPEMFRDHLIQESAGDNNTIDADMDDYDVRIAWVRPRRPS